MNCPKCGRACPLDANFCARCGAKLEHDNVIFEENAAPAPAEEPAPEADARPLAANPVRPERSGESPFVPSRSSGAARDQRKPLFEGYEPVEEPEAERPRKSPARETVPEKAAMEKADKRAAQMEEPTAIYQRPRPDKARAEAPRIREERAAALLDDDEFGWDDEKPAKSSTRRPARARAGEETKPIFTAHQRGTLPPVDDEEDELEAELSHSSAKKAPKRKPVPDAKKPVSHIRPVSQDKPLDDPVFLFEDEEDEAETRHSGVGLKILVVITLVALILFGVYFVKYTETGRRWQASLGISGNPSDYIELGNYHMTRGSYTEAAKDYYSAFRLEQTNYDLAMQVAQGLTEATDYDRGVRLYKYIIDNWPDRREPVDKLLALYQELGRTAEYDELRRPAGDQVPAQAPNPAPEAPQAPQAGSSVAAPTVSVPGGDYGSAVQLALSAVSGAEIYYTLDGSQPTVDSRRYEGFIILDESQTYTLRAVAVLDGAVSPELREVYQLNIG